MTQYARFNLLIELDTYSTYPDASRHKHETNLTPAEGFVRRTFEAGASGSALTITVDEFTTVTLFAVTYEGASTDGDVTVTWTDTAGNVCTAVLTYGGAPLVTPDIDPTVDPTFVSADSTTPLMSLSILGT